MIGNDIIDLDLTRIESNWKRKGFLDKIFTHFEKRMIAKAENPEILVWDLWSRKEAAYKIYNRISGQRAFMPLRIECFDISVSENIIFGKVHCEKFVFHTKTTINLNSIHTIAALHKKKLDDLVVSFTNPYTEKSKFMLQKDKNGIPFERHRQSLEEFPVSISHHGNYCSYITIKK